MSELRLGEFHEFAGSGKRYLYLAPSGAIFELDDAAGAIIEMLKSGPRTRQSLIDDAIAHPGLDVEEADVEEAYFWRTLTSGGRNSMSHGQVLPRKGGRA